MSSAILGVGLAVPEHRHRQKDLVAFMARAHGFGGARSRALRRVYERTRIDTRFSCLPDYGSDPEAFEFYPNNERMEPAPSTGARMERFRSEAPSLALRACRDLFSKPDMPTPCSVDHLLAVTCTGFFAPGLDVLLADALGLRADVGRTLIGFQGCQGGLTALRVADALSRAGDGATVLVVCVELCTLHFRTEATEANLVANALFADGAAAALVGPPGARSGANRLEIEQTATWLQPGSREAMVWTIGDDGFALRLSDLVPKLLRADVPRVLEDAFDLAAPEIPSLAHWAVHPGGAGILDGLERALDLRPDALGASREILRRYGNMSSATIWFVLEAILSGARGEGPGIALAFGPGLTVEATRFRRVGAGCDGIAAGTSTTADASVTSAASAAGGRTPADGPAQAKGGIGGAEGSRR